MATFKNNKQRNLFEGPTATHAEIAFACTALHFQNMCDRTIAVTYGRLLDGARAILIGSDGQLIIGSSQTKMLHNADGLMTGFVVKRLGCAPIKVDYCDIDALAAGSAGEYRSILQAGNMQLAMRMNRAAEELLASALTALDADRWRAAIEALGLDPKTARLLWRARHRIARMLIDHMLDNAIPPERQGALALIRMMPPSRRQNHAHLLSTARNTDLERDTIYQAPILILFPKWVSKYFSGNRMRDIMDELNLPRGASNIVMQAIGPIIYLLGMQRPQQDAAPADLAWLTPALTAAIGQHAPRMFCQRIVMNLTCLTFAATRDVQLAEAVGIWACHITEKFKNEGELNFETATKISNWIAASDDRRDAAGVPHWHDKISLTTAITAANNYEAHRMRADEPDAVINSFDWALRDGSIPGTPFHLFRIDSFAMLAAEALRMNNCAKIYFDEAMRGGCALYIIRRPARPQDKPSSVHHCDKIGGPAVTACMLMLRKNGHGEPYIAQLYAAENRQPSSEIRHGIEMLIG